jgi:hypothetical protein
MAVQHRAVVASAASHFLDEVHDIVSDVVAAAARGTQAAEEGDVRTLAAWRYDHGAGPGVCRNSDGDFVSGVGDGAFRPGRSPRLRTRPRR